MHILTTGDTLNNGEFRIVKKIGEGGFGITYLATYTDLLEGKQEQVVIKEFFMSGCFREGTTVTTGSLNPTLFEKFKNGFLDEARLLYKFKNHKHIVNVRKFFNENGTAYFAMDYVEGSDMEVYAQTQPKNRITEAEAINMLRQIGSALTEIHAQNYTHRDLKPQNILRHQNGEVYVLIDFGIARDFVVDESQVTSTIIKSEGYAPPEQYRQRVRRGDFTDVYGLAATLYRLLTGEKPTDALSRRDDLDEGIFFASPKKYNPTISPKLDAAIMKALELKPKDRFQTIAEFVAAVTTVDDEQKTAVFDIPIYQDQNEQTAIFDTPIYQDQTKIEQVEEIKQQPIFISKQETTPTKELNLTPVLIGIGILLFFIVGFGLYRLVNEKTEFVDETIVQADSVPSIGINKEDLIVSDNKNEQTISKEEIISQIERNMVYVQGGSFMMGNNDGNGYEKPVHKVTLSSFKVSKYEVTQTEWKAVMGNNPSEFKGCDNCPVENASWDDIQTFLKKLNELTGKKYRLLSEAEWEYAARGGNKSKGYTYAGSNFSGNVAWYDANSGSKTHPVGQKQPNELGLYDMSGNILEWCQDWHDPTYYERSNNLINPINKNKSFSKVIRGGSWGFNGDLLRLTYRLNVHPSVSDGCGCRIGVSASL
jgi:formylglycine-generating enzyme required for sulfatase activity